MASIFDLASFGSNKKDVAADIAEIGTGIFATKGIETAAKDEQQLLQEQEKMAETAFYQQGLQRARRLRQVMSQATVEEAARGVSVASPSFKSVQRSSFEKFNEDRDAAALNLSFEKREIALKQQEVRDKEKSQKISVWGKIATDIL